MPKQVSPTTTSAPDNQPSTTSGADFRRFAAGVIRTLPSGKIVRQRPLNLFRMLKAGKIPDPLTPYVLGLVYEEDKDDKRTKLQKALDWQELLDLVTKESIDSVIFADSPTKDEEVNVESFSYDDQADIYTWARHPVEEVKTFPVPEPQGGDLEPGADGGEGEQATNGVPAGS